MAIKATHLDNAMQLLMPIPSAEEVIDRGVVHERSVNACIKKSTYETATGYPNPTEDINSFLNKRSISSCSRREITQCAAPHTYEWSSKDEDDCGRRLCDGENLEIHLKQLHKYKERNISGSSSLLRYLLNIRLPLASLSDSQWQQLQRQLHLIVSTKRSQRKTHLEELQSLPYSPDRQTTGKTTDAAPTTDFLLMEDTRPPPPVASMAVSDKSDALRRSSFAVNNHNHQLHSPSLWRRLFCCCCSRRRPAHHPPHGRSTYANGRASFVPDDIRSSHTNRPKTEAELHAEKAMKKKIEHFSTMRVHMKRVQLCLEQEKRSKFYKELLVYLVFLSVIMIALLSLPIHFPYEQNAALSDLYFDEEFPNVTFKKTFDDVATESELWQWVNGPLLQGYYDPPIRNNRRIGSMLLRTGRVKGDLCRNMEKNNDLVLFADEICYPEFTTHNEMKEPYGDKNGVLQQQYRWDNSLGTLTRSQTFTPSLVNHEMNYGKGGYPVYLPRDNYTAAQEIIAQLEEDFFTDGSRYFAVNFALYNPRSNLFTHIQALFEMSDTDYMEITARVKSFRILASYRNTEDFIWDNFLIIVLFIATFWLLFRELSDLREHGLRKYVQSLWNLLDMLQLVLLIVFLEQWIVYLVDAEEMRSKLYDLVSKDCDGAASDQQSAADCYVELLPLAQDFASINDFAAALAIVSVAIVFKYLRLNSRLNLLWRTLRFAAKDLLAFVAIFFTIFFGFSVMGFLIFGSSVRQYHSLSVSLTSCFQMLLGAFDYNQIYTANPAMAGIFFFSFMICIYLICVNMFIAIMSEYYSHAQNEKKTHEENKRNLITSTQDSSAMSANGDFADSLQFMDVEYDVAKQIKSYLQRLRVRVRMPPSKGEVTAYSTQQLLLCGYQRVLLVDYDYLMAERRRLRMKFRAVVRVIITTYNIIRLIYPDYHMHVKRQLLVDKRPRASSTDSYADVVDFPVTYLPISSTGANTVEILKGLKRGMRIEMDDGSLTKDQITLEVLGGQNEYIPSNFRRRTESLATNDEMQLRISEATNIQNDDDPSQRQPFGLRFDHGEFGAASHIRCCRVIYNGDTLLNGMETCLLPRRTWVRYFVRYIFWGYVRDVLTCKRRKKKVNRLISDMEVDRLITQSFNAPGRGISCRFDELVRNFRMFIAKKVHKRNLNIHNLEERILNEVITFLERFPSALAPLDKRELEGYKYVPQPIDTSRVRLPNSINLLTELLSQNAHEVWAVGRIEQGWRWGLTRDNEAKLHPDLIPYEDLSEQDKQYDRDTSMSALKVITALGYILEPPPHAEAIDIQFGVPAEEEGGTYTPRPIPTEDVKVPYHLRSVIELLAENTHEVWAKMRLSQGWKYGPRRDDAKKEHNGLVPYIYLTQEEKQMDRNTAMQTVKLILRCGFAFVHKNKITSSSRAKKKPSSSGSIKVFGRNENPELKHVPDAVALARGTTRAKRAFMTRGQQGGATGSGGSSGGAQQYYTNRMYSAAGSSRSLRSASSMDLPPSSGRTVNRALSSATSTASSIPEEDEYVPLAPPAEEEVEYYDLREAPVSTEETAAASSSPSSLPHNTNSNGGDAAEVEEHKSIQ